MARNTHKARKPNKKPKPKSCPKPAAVVSPDPDPRALGHPQPSTPPKKKTGRPSIRRAEVVERILEMVASGYPLRRAIKYLRTELDPETVPSRPTFNEWLQADAELSSRFARARAEGHDALADEVLDIADDGTNDYVEKETERGVLVLVDSEHIQRSRLRVDARLKLLAKWDPKRYGDKVEHELQVAPLVGLYKRLAGR